MSVAANNSGGDTIHRSLARLIRTAEADRHQRCKHSTGAESVSATSHPLCMWMPPLASSGISSHGRDLHASNISSDLREEGRRNEEGRRDEEGREEEEGRRKGGGREEWRKGGREEEGRMEQGRTCADTCEVVSTWSTLAL
eukprot:GHVU01195825.1.p1 GENE.GHVU01195825.1~~GHVU01195825.1.p1  ORF type:complete len:141 (+),score=28.07 GHVU01195825.1:775-1197(+)